MDVRVAEGADADGKRKAGWHHAEMGRAVKQPAMCGGHGYGEARWKWRARTHRAEVERWDRERGPF